MQAISANDRQVGGSHYKSDYQHWDFVYDTGLDYYEGCATKYITRRKGNRMEDLQKAMHFLEKRVSLNGSSSERFNTAVNLCDRFATANQLSYVEYMIIKRIVQRHYHDAVKRLQALIDAGGW
jgi:hypothetical protein